MKFNKNGDLRTDKARQWSDLGPTKIIFYDWEGTSPVFNFAGRKISWFHCSGATCVCQIPLRCITFIKSPLLSPSTFTFSLLLHYNIELGLLVGFWLVDCPTQLTLITWICQLCSMTNTSEKYERTQQGNLLTIGGHPPDPAQVPKTNLIFSVVK